MCYFIKTEASRLSLSLSQREINSFAGRHSWIIHAIMPAFVLTYYEVNNYTCHGFKMQYIQFAPNFIFPKQVAIEYFLSTEK